MEIMNDQDIFDQLLEKSKHFLARELLFQNDRASALESALANKEEKLRESEVMWNHETRVSEDRLKLIFELEEKLRVAEKHIRFHHALRIKELAEMNELNKKLSELTEVQSGRSDEFKQTKEAKNSEHGSSVCRPDSENERNVEILIENEVLDFIGRLSPHWQNAKTVGLLDVADWAEGAIRNALTKIKIPSGITEEAE